MDLSQLVLVVAGLALVYLVVMYPWTEHMTVKDVQKKQDFHETKPTSWDMNKVSTTPKSTSKKAPVGTALIGPEVPALDQNAPQPTTDGGKNGSGVYPDIYGPELLKEPGSKDGGDSSNPPPYDYVPAAEFPAGPAEPAPYLNDFSKILKT